MKTSIFALILVFVAASAASAATARVKLADGSVLEISASQIDGIGQFLSTVTLKGEAHLKTVGSTGSDTLEAQADKIVVAFSRKTDPKQAGQDMIRSADLIGSPQLTYVTKDPSTGALVKTTATSTSATYDGTTRTVRLKGNVKIVNENPAVFDGPAVMTGDEATINLRPKLGPDEPLFSIKSSPGPSRIEVTPKPKEEEKPKK